MILIIIVLVRYKEIVFLEEGGHPLADGGAKVEAKGGHQGQLDHPGLGAPRRLGSAMFGVSVTSRLNNSDGANF